MHSNKNVALSPAQFIGQQIIFTNPGIFPLWIAGLLWLFASHDDGGIGQSQLPISSHLSSSSHYMAKVTILLLRTRCSSRPEA